MTIHIEDGLKYAGRIDAKITNFGEEDKEQIATDLLNEILRIADQDDFTISIDVFKKISMGKGV